MRLFYLFWVSVLTSSVLTGLAYADEKDPFQPSKRPSLEQMKASSMFSYKPEPSALQECLGRVIWNSEKSIEWPVYYGKDQLDSFNHFFSKKVFSRGDAIRFGNIDISVKGVKKGTKEEIIEFLPNNQMRSFKERLDEAELEEKAAFKNRNGDVRQRQTYHLATSRVARFKKSIEELSSKYSSYDSGIADSYGYGSVEEERAGNGKKYSILKTYLFIGDYMYNFESRETIKPDMSEEKHREKFSALLKSFRPRRMNEIPTELGVCIPFGFLPDDGRTITDIKQSFRWKVAPGVLYTIHTGNVQARQLKSTVLNAVASSQVGRFGTDEEAEVKKHVDQRIGPRQVKIGGLTGEQGGVTLKVTAPGAKPYEAYSVYSGYAGWLGTDVLPFIIVDMQSFTIDQAPELKENPPPFKQSKQRLDDILKYMRIRQTNPLMPELAGQR
ncbi:hypothetical protein J2X54_001565 [Duganella sp. 3397]|uniref:T6SS immunity protein Tli4 family protein n=1 Tax=Duganella sp. 3397 TaxID=2817732 RepID=UPI00285E3089|nr:T6SS immunity protein Tli4 family protein [Duganella sp. 3397]MDR7049117.1 hypothetical protein [Duganella sp. 3397]